MSLYQIQYKDTNGNVVDLPLNAVKLGGETLQQIKSYINAKYTKPNGGIPSTDLADSYYLSSNPNGYTNNTGTVTSVRVQAGTGLSSSVSTAQSATLNTTISIASGYKLPSTSEWSSKADDTDVVHKSGDSMTGQLIAQNNVAYSTAQVRNIILSTSAPTSTDGNNGDIWIVYVA